MRIKHHKLNDTTFSIPENHIKNISNIFEIGHSFPPAGYRSNPLTANTYVIHYLVSGRGFCNDIPVQAPCIFVRLPYSNNVYSVDRSPDAPKWEQYWIKFSGGDSENITKILGVTPDSPVAPCNYINQAIEVFNILQNPFSYKHRNDQLFMLSHLFTLLSMHNSETTQKSDSYSPYTRTVCNYIHENYANITNEAELANIVHISVNHLGRIFKADTGMTPLQYLINYRIGRAKKLLQTSDMSVNAISLKVGFANANYFCNVFKKHCNGLSPKLYRENFLSQKAFNEKT